MQCTRGVTIELDCDENCISSDSNVTAKCYIFSESKKPLRWKVDGNCDTNFISNDDINMEQQCMRDNDTGYGRTTCDDCSAQLEHNNDTLKVSLLSLYNINNGTIVECSLPTSSESRTCTFYFTGN